MTAEQTSKEIIDYFGLTVNEFDKKKLLSILSENHTLVKVIVEKQKPMYVLTKPVNLLHELSLACDLYGVDSSIVIGRGKKGGYKKDQAVVHFCRKVKIADKTVKSTQLAHLLQKNHSTILHYWYHSKANVPYPQLPTISKNKKFYKQYEATI